MSNSTSHEYFGFIEIDGVEYSVQDIESIAVRNLREAWEKSGNDITVNMAKAKEIWRNKIRDARADEFAKLDADFMKALEIGADTSEIAQKKQALRDAPSHPDIESAQTPEALMQVQPIPNVVIE